MGSEGALPIEIHKQGWRHVAAFLPTYMDPLRERPGPLDQGVLVAGEPCFAGLDEPFEDVILIVSVSVLSCLILEQ